MSQQLESGREPLFTRRFAGMWVFSFFTFFSAFQLLPAIPFRILQLGGTKAQAGWFLAVYTFSSAFAAPVMGSVADRFGRRRTLVLASILFIFFSLAYGVITTLPLLLVTGMIHGAIWSSILASSSAIMSDFIPETRRTEGMAYWGLSSMGAVSIAPAVGLWVYHAGWFTLCLELAVMSVLMAIAGALLPTTDATRLERIVLREMWDWGVTRTALSLAVTAFGYGGITSYAAIMAVERNVTPRSIYFTTFALTIVVVRIFTSHLGDRFGPKVILYPSLLSAPIALLLLAQADSRIGFIASAMIFGVGFGSMYPAFIAFVLANTDPDRRARTFGSIVWAFDAGIGAGSLVIGAIAEKHGLGTAFRVAAALSCLGVPIFMMTSRRLIRSGTAVASHESHDSPTT